MEQSLLHVALVVRDYDEAIEFFCRKLHFTLVEDTYQPEQDKRWVVVRPPGSTGTSLLLARAATPEQEPFIGRQSGGQGVFVPEHGRFLAGLRRDALPGDKFREGAEGGGVRDGGGVRGFVREFVGFDRGEVRWRI